MATKAVIVTRSIQFNDTTEEQHKTRIQRFLAAHKLPIVADWKPIGTVNAFVNEGRWVAECPMDGCMGAEFVDPDWPFLVCSGSCGSGPYTVKFPSQLAAIEAELIKRPVPATRNWYPGEKVSDLQRENKEKGVK